MVRLDVKLEFEFPACISVECIGLQVDKIFAAAADSGQLTTNLQGNVYTYGQLVRPMHKAMY